MPPITEISPEILRDRHQLSPQQINALFGKVAIRESFEEKGTALGKVAEFLRVTDALNAEEVGFIPLKGPILSFRLYGDATIRYFSDLDILTDASSITRVTNIIEAHKYQVYDLPWPERTRGQRQLLKYRHHISFFNPENNVALEIHWQLMDRQWLNFKDTARLVEQNLTTENFMSRSFRVLGSEIELLFLIIHGGVHHWGMLKWIVDVNEYIKTQNINWDHFTKLTDTLEADRFVALCNSVLSEYFPEGPLLPCSRSAPKDMFRFSKKRIESDVYTVPDSSRTLFQHMHFSMNAYPGLLYKVRLAKNILANSIMSGKINRLFG